MKKALHEVFLFGAASVAAFAVHRALEEVWEHKTREPAPKNPAAKGVSWKDALLWGASAGALAGIARVVTRRSYTRLTGITTRTKS